MGKIDERFKPTYDKLIEIRNQLEKLSLTQAWSLRETDLYGYQRQLDRIDEARVDGNFEDAQGNKADLHAQRVSLGNFLPGALANLYRLSCTSFAGATPTSTASSIPRNQSPRHCSPCSTSYRHYGGAWLR